MALREEIEAALAEAAAERGVRQLAIDGDEEVWVAGVAATDGDLEVRVGDRGPRRGLRRRRPDRAAMEALGFRDDMPDAWALFVPAGSGQAARGAAAAVSALTDGLGVPGDARAEVFFTQRGAKDLVAAVEALASGREEIAFVAAGRPAENILALVALGDRVRVQTIWPEGGELRLPGFEGEDVEQLSTREVDRDEAVAAAQVVLDARGVSAGDPLYIHLGA